MNKSRTSDKQRIYELIEEVDRLTLELDACKKLAEHRLECMVKAINILSSTPEEQSSRIE